MATFEVFIPVQGEVIFTVEADNHIEAQEIAMELDFSEGELNVDTDWSDEMRSEQIAGDDDDASIPVMREAAPLAQWERELLYPWLFTSTLDGPDVNTYEMRHIREP